MAANSQQFGMRMDHSPMKVNEIGQLASSVSKLEAQGSGKLPSQTVMNPRENASAILLQSGKEVDNQTPHEPKKKQGEKEVSCYLKMMLNICSSNVIIQLADRSNAYPLGVVEDVLVWVGELIFPADFYILHMENSVLTSKSALILFGRPFLKTAKTKIDVNDGTLTMEFDGETVKFNIFDAMKYPADDHSVFSIDVVDTIMQDVFELSMEDELEVVISQGIQEISTNQPLSVEVQ
ncbi:hypothetical protein P3X46_019989 [Hevea brasiliensis]|uniref:Reverse transcriptase domain-containing protein n=1 Tax=Hevea brasiliensis TaxID=3981 RepID=A0ABQ9LPG0_HEVBR|nr:hypothetical protein P3X46_019989 [Hevea brasiliensis]